MFRKTMPTVNGDALTTAAYGWCDMTSWIIVKWWAERSRSWRSIIRMVPVAGRVAPAAVVLNLVIGVLPLGFVVGTSVAIERVAAAGQPPAGGRWGGVLIAVVLAVAALLLQTVLSPFQAAFTELISRRIDGVCARRLSWCSAWRCWRGPWSC
jgi:ATP-binding cassette, subfamily B, bacterial